MKWEKKCLFNRASILGPNGIQTLTVPVHSTGGKSTCIKDIQICYQQDWIRVHTGALIAAYNSSPFFPMFRDEIFTVYSRKHRFLLDLNEELNAIVIGRLSKGNSNKEGDSYESVSDCDFTYLKDPKSIEDHFAPIAPYVQVFADRFPFSPFMSWVDWLSNTGGR